MDKTYVLGINGSNKASAALLKDGQPVAFALEENFTGVKNQAGYPQNAINYCLSQAKIKSLNLASVWIGFLNPTLFLKEKDARSTFGWLADIKPYFTKLSNELLFKFPRLNYLHQLRQKTPLWKLLSYLQKKYVAQKLSLSVDAIHLIDHHLAHAAAAYYTNPSKQIRNKKNLVITMDGAGDVVCSRIFVVKNGSWKEIAKTPNDFSLGELYQEVTKFLGFRPNQDESKVMNLSSSGRSFEADQVFKIFKQMMHVEQLSLKSTISAVAFPTFLKKNLSIFKAKDVAWGIQRLTEEILLTLIGNAIKKTDIHYLSLGGGVFMNSKANKKLAHLKGVKNIWVCPSPTDNSTALGAAYFGYNNLKIKLAFNNRFY